MSTNISTSDQGPSRRTKRAIFITILVLCVISISYYIATKRRFRINPDQWHAIVDTINGNNIDVDVDEEHEELRGYEEGGYYGFKDSSGKLIINPQFLRASHYFIQSRSWAQDELGIGIIDTSGKFVSNMRFDLVEDFSCSRALVGIIQPNGWMKYGFVDLQGQLVIPCKYDYADSFYGGYALVGNEVFISRIQRDIGHPGERQFEWTLIDRYGAKRSGFN